MQIVSYGDNLHKMSKPIFQEKYQFAVCRNLPYSVKGYSAINGAR